MGFIDKTFKVLLKGVLLLFLVVGLIYFGSCVYGNVKALDSNPRDVPEVADAQYKVVIVNTGNTLLSDDAERIGTVVTLNGYWELMKIKFKYHKESILLDEDIFGPIKITRR